MADWSTVAPSVSPSAWTMQGGRLKEGGCKEFFMNIGSVTPLPRPRHHPQHTHTPLDRDV